LGNKKIEETPSVEHGKLYDLVHFSIRVCMSVCVRGHEQEETEEKKEKEVDGLFIFQSVSVLMNLLQISNQVS
jgi:hypothetical protein